MNKKFLLLYVLLVSGSIFGADKAVSSVADALKGLKITVPVQDREKHKSRKSGSSKLTPTSAALSSLTSTKAAESVGVHSKDADDEKENSSWRNLSKEECEVMRSAYDFLQPKVLDFLKTTRSRVTLEAFIHVQPPAFSVKRSAPTGLYNTSEEVPNAIQSYLAGKSARENRLGAFRLLKSNKNIDVEVFFDISAEQVAGFKTAVTTINGDSSALKRAYAEMHKIAVVGFDSIDRKIKKLAKDAGDEEE